MLHLFEILLVMPFINAKLERMFSRILRVKSDSRNRLTRDHLDLLLRIDEEGESLEMFNSEPAINLWFSDKVRRLTVSSHRSSTMKREKRSDTEFVNITELAMSDLEDQSDTIFEGFAPNSISASIFFRSNPREIISKGGPSSFYHKGFVTALCNSSLSPSV